ncbi:hypothetical protein Vafri_13074 [Volvox africanus]|uniref:Uncharacterized protein n=1 Tax=Volvox africanus TaxID=51714 RepID=A0A8J4BB18_9CHLO|nr:hypothetical protein Vafri_13074 [Volvox africanus]
MSQLVCCCPCSEVSPKATPSPLAAAGFAELAGAATADVQGCGFAAAGPMIAAAAGAEGSCGCCDGAGCAALAVLAAEPPAAAAIRSGGAPGVGFEQRRIIEAEEGSWEGRSGPAQYCGGIITVCIEPQ